MIELQSPIGNLVALHPSDVGKVEVYLRHGWQVIRYDTRRVMAALARISLSAQQAGVVMERLTTSMRRAEAALRDAADA